MSGRSVEDLHPMETLELEYGLSLVPRIRLLLTVHRADASVKPIDEWQLKSSLIAFLRSNFSLTVPEDDVHIRRFKDLKKRKRHDPVAEGTLFIRDLSSLRHSNKSLSEWRKTLVDKLDDIELNLVGVRFRLSVALPESDDFDRTKKEWEELVAFGEPGYSRGGRRQPDTIVLRGVPSRWFAETRVSSKPSMLVTHSIFSALGKIRNLDAAEDNNIGKDADEDDGDIVSGLQCKIVVRFEDYKEFCNAMKVLCGRSLQKQGSRLKADYEVTWDKDDLFRSSRTHREDSSRWPTSVSAGGYKSEAPRSQSYFSHFSAHSTRSKRFKE